MDQEAFLRDCVVTIASDDYENFELILKNTKQAAASRGIDVSAEEVTAALRCAIDDGLVEVYVLSPQPPYSTKVEYTPGRLREFWYYVTPRGKSAAKGIPSLSGELSYFYRK
jgi:hypothetical protein